MGEILNEELSTIDSKIIKETRGRGLFRAIEVAHDARVNGNDFAYKLMECGILTKATHDYSLRLAPPLVINEAQIKDAAKKIKKAVKMLEQLNKERRSDDRNLK